MIKSFDYIIIGGGLAGLQLALKFRRDRFFEQKTFAIIDPSTKTQNDKTWCFWEIGDGQWDPVIYKTWGKGLFKSRNKYIELDLAPYTYKMVRSQDFYSYAKAELLTSPNWQFIEDKIERIDAASNTAYGKYFTISGLHIFDSRISQKFYKDSTCTKILQHFKGWIIETPNAQFNPEEFTMMDFTLKHKETTSFTYVLPISPTRALVEYTFFSPSLEDDAVYESMLSNYISDTLKIKEYNIEETEEGVIPMTDFPFHKQNTSKITKIGTAGSWVKGSTGYSFKHTEKKVDQIIKNIKEGSYPSKNLISKKGRWYDKIFLDVLQQRNDLGEEVFSMLYTKNTPQEIFRFLDEETSFLEEVKIMYSLIHFQFIKSFFRKGM